MRDRRPRGAGRLARSDRPSRPSSGSRVGAGRPESCAGTTASRLRRTSRPTRTRAAWSCRATPDRRTAAVRHQRLYEDVRRDPVLAEVREQRLGVVAGPGVGERLELAAVDDRAHVRTCLRQVRLIGRVLVLDDVDERLVGDPAMYGVPASRALVSVLDGAQRRGDGVRPTPGGNRTGPVVEQDVLDPVRALGVLGQLALSRDVAGLDDA